MKSARRYKRLPLTTVFGLVDELPSARFLRDVAGWVRIGTHTVSFSPHYGNQDRPWRVYGPPGADDVPECLDEFARYREAVAYAKRAQQKPSAGE